jgi:hypothetical protein
VKRYPLDALQKVRKAEVDARSTLVAAEVEKTERARRSVLGARALRERAEESASTLAAAECARVESGVATAGDLQALAAWHAAESARLTELREKERRAAEALVAQKRAEDGARQELATKKAEEKAVERHRERWSKEREREHSQAEEEAAEDVYMARRARDGGE